MSEILQLKAALPHLADLIESFDALIEAQEQAQSKEPRRFTFGAQTYIHIPGTETFTVPDAPLNENNEPSIVFTALQVMKQAFPATRSMRQRILPKHSAEYIYLLGNSARYKILRAVQLHYAEPPITAETDAFTPFFQFLSEGVEDHWQVQQQYSSCKWASPKNEALATSLLLHYGWAQDFKIGIPGCCIYQLRRTVEGIRLTLSEPHTYNDRLFAACTRASEVNAAFKSQKHKAPYDLLFKEACRVFFSYNGYYVSITSDYRQAIVNKIQAHCLHLTNALDSATPTPPFIDEPENPIPVKYDPQYGEPVEYLLKWEDFEMEEISEVQQSHLETIGINKSISGLLKKFEENGLDPNGEYTDAELRQFCNARLLRNTRANGTLIETRKVGRVKYWKLNYERS